MRQQLRQEKRRRYLDAAVVIVMRDGFDGLTMGAIAREVGAAVGTIYGYFPAKGALMSELQIYAIETIVGAWTEARDTWSADLTEAGLSESRLALAAILAFGEYFSQLRSAYPEEFRLQQMQLAERTEIFDDADLSRLIPAAAALLRCSYQVLDSAARAGAIVDPDASEDRSITLALTLNGLALIDNVPYVAELISSSQLSRQLLLDLVVGWGADPIDVDAVIDAVTLVADTTPLHALPGYQSHRARNVLVTVEPHTIDLSDNDFAHVDAIVERDDVSVARS